MDDGKYKGVAIALALFAPPLTWLYTYKRDSAKFLVGLLLSGLGFSGIPLAYATDSILPVGLMGLNVFVLVWALGDVISKPTEWYIRYPNN